MRPQTLEGSGHSAEIVGGLGLTPHLGSNAIWNEHGQRIVGNPPALGSTNNDASTAAMPQLFVVQHLVKPAYLSLTLNVAFNHVIGPAPTLIKYRAGISLKLRNGSTFIAIGTQKNRIVSVAGKIVRKLSLCRIVMQAV